MPRRQCPAVAAVRALWARSWTAAVRELDDLAERVVGQTRRRMFDGETVPAGEEVASLFEPHTDIIRKGGRRTHYGHKINLTTGRGLAPVDWRARSSVASLLRLCRR